LHRGTKSSRFCTVGQMPVFASDAISYRYLKKQDRVTCDAGLPVGRGVQKPDQVRPEGCWGGG
jgi:hypothetical protein